MSSRPWHRPQTVEIQPDKPGLADSLAIAVGLAVLIVSVRLWRLMFRNSVRKEE